METEGLIGATMNLNFDEPRTPAEEAAYKILVEAELNNDDDYRRIAMLIDDAVSDLVDEPDHGLQE